jgi:hypothetical protein
MIIHVKQNDEAYVQLSRTYTVLYRVIKKSLGTWWLQYRKLQVMFKVSPASLQTFIDRPNFVLEDCVQYSIDSH